MTKHPDIFAALAAPFDPKEVKQRDADGGRRVSYVTARTVMNRLDAVLGPENWWDAYRSGGDNSVLCELTIRLPDGSTLTKSDAGGFAGMADQGDDDKSGYSDAFKRAAVKFGVGRYLYRDGVPSFVQERADVELDVQPPAPPPPAPATNGHAQANGNGNGNGKTYGAFGRPGIGPGSAGVSVAPRPALPFTANGKGLFRWVKEQEQRHGVGLLKYLNGWGRLQEFPGRMIDWDMDQVALAYQEAARKLASIESQESE